MIKASRSGGVARGGRAGDWAPQSEAHSTHLYRGLWRAVILSPGQPPTPLQPPHFEKCSYAPAQGHRSVCWRWFKEFWAHWDDLFQVDWFNIFGTGTVFLCHWSSLNTFLQNLGKVYDLSGMHNTLKITKSPSPYIGCIILVHPHQGRWKGAFIYEIDIDVGTGWEKNRKKKGIHGWNLTLVQNYGDINIWCECNFWSMVRAVLEKKHLILIS